MKPAFSKKTLLSSIILIFLLLSMFFAFDIPQRIKYQFTPKENLVLTIKPINPVIESLASDSSNKYYFEIIVCKKDGTPIEGAPITISTNDIGILSSKSTNSNAQGFSIVYYTPPNTFTPGESLVNIVCEIKNTGVRDSISLNLKPVPVVLVHGYLETPLAFENMHNFLLENEFNSFNFGYDWKIGVEKASSLLSDYLLKKTKKLSLDGFQTSSFSLVTHSLGGIVSRYYTCNDQYVHNTAINKIIFISVPHHGSDIAKLGEDLFDDQSIKDLKPRSELFVKTFPSLINKGLNPHIPVSNFLAQYDEVVTEESASLLEWNIKTKLFNVGDNNLTVDNLIKGVNIDAANHNTILNNKTVFDNVAKVLIGQQDYPSKP